MNECGPINFLPDDQCSRRVRRPAMLLAGILLLTIAIGASGAFIASSQGLHESQRRHDRASQEYRTAIAAHLYLQSLDREQQRLLQRGNRAAALLPKEPSSDLLAKLTNALPAGVVLTQIKVESRPLPASTAATFFDQKKQMLEDARRADSDPLPAPAPMETVVTLRGVGESPGHVANYCRNLAANPALKNVKLAADEISGESGDDSANRRQFEVQMIVGAPGARTNDVAEESAPVAAAH